MKRVALTALALTPFLVVAAGIVAARFLPSSFGHEQQSPCTHATMSIAYRNGELTIAPDAKRQNASCGDIACNIPGPERVEFSSGASARCFDVGAGSTLSVSKRDGQVLLVAEDGNR